MIAINNDIVIYMSFVSSQTIRQFIKFGIVGISNTLVSLGIYYLFVFINPRLYQFGNVVGWIVSVLNAFYWNNKYVFTINTHDAYSTLRRLGKSYLSYGFTFLLSVLLLHVEVEMLHFSELICPIINLCITIPLNYVLNRFWTFRNDDTAVTTETTDGLLDKEVHG